MYIVYCKDTHIINKLQMFFVINPISWFIFKFSLQLKFSSVPLEELQQRVCPLNSMNSILICKDYSQLF